MKCPHCGKETPKTVPVHLNSERRLWTVCGVYYAKHVTGDPKQVTCAHCKRTRVFKEAS